MNTLTRALGILAVVTQLTGCGDPNEFPDLSTSQQSIIDGKRSTADDFPSTGAMIMEMHLAGEMSGTTICSGTLIAPDVVLTAAHCTPGDAMFGDELEGVDARFFFTFHPDLTAYDGENPAQPPRTTAVSRWITHPGYVGSPENIEDTLSMEFEDGLKNDSDIALLFLAEPVLDVKPTPILRPAQAALLNAGTSVLVAGYGQQHRAAEAEDPAVKYHGPSRLHEVGTFELQVGDRASLSAPAPEQGLATKCYGDSGGPTYLTVDGRLHVIGVTSRGYDNEPDCNRAGIDTRVDAFAQWIDTVMETGCRDEQRVADACRAPAPSAGATDPESRPEPTTAAPVAAEPGEDAPRNTDGTSGSEGGGCDVQGNRSAPGWMGLLMFGVLGLGRRRLVGSSRGGNR